MSRVELPDGAWAELHAPRKVQERKRRRYIQAMTAMTQSVQSLPKLPPDAVDADGKSIGGTPDMAFFGPEQQALSDAAFDELTCCLVSAWSFDLPVAVESLLDLPTDAFDALRKACMELGGELVPDYSASPDPKAISSE